VANYINHRNEDEYCDSRNYNRSEYNKGRNHCQDNIIDTKEYKDISDSHKDRTKYLLKLHSNDDEWRECDFRTIEYQEQQVHNLDEQAKTFDDYSNKAMKAMIKAMLILELTRHRVILMEGKQCDSTDGRHAPISREEQSDSQYRGPHK
jgi:hypothetical protein